MCTCLLIGSNTVSNRFYILLKIIFKPGFFLFIQIFLKRWNNCFLWGQIWRIHIGCPNRNSFANSNNKLLKQIFEKHEICILKNMKYTCTIVIKKSGSVIECLWKKFYHSFIVPSNWSNYSTVPFSIYWNKVSSALSYEINKSFEKTVKRKMSSH